MRPATMQRTPLAQHLGRMLETLEPRGQTATTEDADESFFSLLHERCCQRARLGCISGQRPE